jgi:hypothetical protein
VTRIPFAAAPILLAAALLLGPLRAAAVEPTPIPNTRVALVVPAGFQLAHGFPGIGLDEDLTSVLVTELPVPLEVSLPTFSAEALAARGITLHRSGVVEVSGRRATLVHASQRVAGMDFRKWMLLLGDETETVMVVATTPIELEATYQEALVETLASVQWTPQPRETPAALSFSIREPEPLRIVTSAGNALVLSDPAYDGSGERLPPVVSVGYSLARVQIADLPAFARGRLEETVSIFEIEILEESERRLDGMPAHAIEADAHDANTNREVRVRQVLATDGDRYYLIQGIAERNEAERFSELFDAVVTSFALTEPSKTEGLRDGDGLE